MGEGCEGVDRLVHFIMLIILNFISTAFQTDEQTHTPMHMQIQTDRYIKMSQSLHSHSTTFKLFITFDVWQMFLTSMPKMNSWERHRYMNDFIHVYKANSFSISYKKIISGNNTAGSQIPTNAVN